MLTWIQDVGSIRDLRDELKRSTDIDVAIIMREGKVQFFRRRATNARVEFNKLPNNAPGALVKPMETIVAQAKSQGIDEPWVAAMEEAAKRTCEIYAPPLNTHAVCSDGNGNPMLLFNCP